MRKFVVILLLFLIAIPVLLFLSAQFSLDRSFAHSRETDALPLLTESTKTVMVRIPVGDMFFRARVAGMDNQGPALILLHGFPETSIMWEPLIKRAASEGFRVVAYDHRGFSPGARPPDVNSYTIANYVKDLFQIADVVRFEEFHLIGHDWGSLVGWQAAINHPDRVKTWASLSIPHPGAFAQDLADPEKRPTYIKVFRVPHLAETLLGFAGFWAMNSMLYATMPVADRDEYNAVFREPGALTSALNLYRALPIGGDMGFNRPTTQPVLYIYGSRDIPAYVNPKVQARLPSFIEGPFESLALDAGHWLIQEKTEIVVDRLMKHLTLHSD